MNPVDLLQLTENTETVAYHRFVLLCKGRENDLFCFFEAKDSQYYSARIKANVKRSYHPIPCGNKNAVVSLWEMVSQKKEYSKYRKCFFVDRDFDSPLKKSDIYETCCYSIENFYVNEECISEILKNEFLLTEEDEAYKKSIELFNKEFLIYANEILLFNGWYAALKYKKEKERLLSTRVSLEEKLPKGFIHLKIGSITSSYDLIKIRDQFPNAIIVADQEVFDAISEIRKSDLSCRLRGKYCFSFLHHFLQYLIEDANSTQTIIKKKTKFNIDKKNMYSQLSQYAKTPQCLVDFLSRLN